MPRHKKSEQDKKRISSRDTVLLLLSIGVFILFAAHLYRFSLRLGREGSPSQSASGEDRTAWKIGKLIVDTSNWKTYESERYGFILNYPDNWETPVLRKTAGDAKWDYQFQFRKKTKDDSAYAGFNVVVYDVAKVKELTNTEEFPAIKNEQLEAQNLCEQITGHLTGDESYPAEQLYIPLTDDCYSASFLYSLTRDEYIYNIVPILKENQKISADPREAAIDGFPEFFSVASHFDLIDIIRPKAQTPVPEITAPMPVSAIAVNGILVCAKKNDHPSVSKQGKGKHLDMECCLDPDEYPNPHCYYPPSKYGKYL